jgi:hypothetical protein
MKSREPLRSSRMKPSTVKPSSSNWRSVTTPRKARRSHVDIEILGCWWDRVGRLVLHRRYQSQQQRLQQSTIDIPSLSATFGANLFYVAAAILNCSTSLFNGFTRASSIVCNTRQCRGRRKLPRDLVKVALHSHRLAGSEHEADRNIESGGIARNAREAVRPLIKEATRVCLMFAAMQEWGSDTFRQFALRLLRERSGH